MSHVVRAPGKAILCGEYAVLDGAPAIAVAVDRHVTARLGQGQRSPFVEAAIAHAGRAFGERGAAAIARLRHGVAVDSSGLYADGAKIGLGSSAAVTAAVVGLAFAEAGHPLDDRERLFAVADAAHAEAQGVTGSGIDVATSVYGGAIRFERTPGSAPTITQVGWPGDLFVSFVFSGHSASTSDLVGRVHRLRERDAARYTACMGQLGEIATEFAHAMTRGDARAVVTAAARWTPALAALGQAADAPIITPFFESLARAASARSAAAKPSGAGGGDLGVVFASRSDVALGLLGYDGRVLSLNCLAPGLSLEKNP